MTERKKIIENLLGDEYFHKFLIDSDKECTEFWEQWKNESSLHADCLDAVRIQLLSMQFADQTPLSANKKSTMWSSISEQIDHGNGHSENKAGHGRLRTWLSVAATVSLLVVSFMAYYFVINAPFPGDAMPTRMNEFVVPSGKLSQLHLEDGTEVRLFAGAKISYPEVFEADIREVYIEGEAFFEVSKDPNRPFVVKTKSLVTTALGTSFNVRTFNHSDHCEVSLVTGKVKVEKVEKSSSSLNEIMLAPGEEAVLDAGEISMHSFNIEDKTGWKDGYIILENKDFAESVAILKRWYNVDFIIENQQLVSNKLGTGKFKNQSLENILQSIGYTFDFNFRIEGDNVFVTF